MPANYPGALPALSTTHQDLISEAILAGSGNLGINQIAMEVNAIGAELGVNPSGVASSIAVRLANAPTFNAKDYGCVGDGSTDDTVALQACVDAAAGKGTVVLPQSTGAYVVSTINVPNSNLAIAGIGSAIIQHKGGSQNPVFYRAQGLGTVAGVVITGLTIRGNGLDAKTTVNGGQTIGGGGTLNVGSTTGFANSGTFNIGITPYTYTNKTATTFTGVNPGATFANGAVIYQEAVKAGVYLVNCTDVLLRECSIDSFMSAGMVVDGCVRYRIQSNKVTNTTIPGGRNAIHLDIDNSDASNVNKSTIGWITENLVDSGLDGGSFGICTTFQSTTNNLKARLVIARNICRNWPNGNAISIESGVEHDISVVHNHCYSSKNGINVGGASLGGADASTYMLISGNFVDTESQADGKGIYIAGSRITCENNVIRSSGDGINVWGSAGGQRGIYNIVQGNIVSIANTDTAARPVGIIYNNCDYGLVAHNTVTREAGGGMGHGISSINIKHSSIHGNVLSGVGGSGIMLQNAATTWVDITDNRVTDANSQGPASANYGIDIYADAMSNIRVRGNVVIDTGTATPVGAGILIRTGPTNVSLIDNETSGCAISVLTAAAIAVHRGNRTPTMPQPNAGVSTSTPGAVTTVNIAHNLNGVTPTDFDARPGDANARGAPSYHVTADGTNVILNFSAALTAATSYTWNWRASKG